MLGVGDRIGRLAAGYDADFVVVNGEPLSGRSHVQEAWVAGHRAWSRHEGSSAIVIRAGRVFDGIHGWIDDGEVLIEDGKVVACGHAVPHPPHARIVDAGAQARITPGFIDAHGYLGLENDRTNVAIDVDVADALSVARADFRDVARAGITTAVIGGMRSNVAGTRMAAIKTASADGEGVVTERLVAIKIAVGGTVDAAEKAIETQLRRAKSYHEAWLKYEAALKAWQEGKVAPEAPKPEAEPAAPAAAKPEEPKKGDEPEASDAVTGTWEGKFSGGPFETPQGCTLKLRLQGNKVIGTGTSPVDPSEEADVSGTFEGKSLSLLLNVETPFGSPSLTLTIDPPETMKGKLDIGGFVKADFEAKRTKKGAPKITIQAAVTPTTVPSNKPKAPKKDEKLEPWRGAFQGEVAVMADVSSPAVARLVSGVFESMELPLIILGDATIEPVLSELGTGTSFVIERRLNTYSHDRRQHPVVNLLEREGRTMAFGSEGSWEASRLPRLARAAVRNGLSPDKALLSLTADAAKMLRLEDRVGRLAKGCDGDVLIFDGDPMELRTRLVRVFVRGKEVTP